MRLRLLVTTLAIALLAGPAGPPLLAADGQTAPVVTAITPGTGSGAARTFRLLVDDADGAGDIDTVEALFTSGEDIRGDHACYLFASGDRLYLRDDAHTAWLGPISAGSTAVLGNSQCALAGAGSAVTREGTRLTVAVTLTFTPGFAGATASFLKATDRAGHSSDWIRAGQWTVEAEGPAPVVITSACPAAALDGDILSVTETTEQEGRVVHQLTTPRCFPAYVASLPEEGDFLAADHRPVPILGRTCGRFDVLLAFVDTPANRARLAVNTALPAGVRALVESGEPREALTQLVAGYTEADLMAGLFPAQAGAVDVHIGVALTSVNRRDTEWGDDGGLGFAAWDAVIVVDDLTPNAGHGVHAWPSLPSSHPIFWGAGGHVLNIDPLWLTPGLVGNELFRRNMPTLPAAYVYGPRTLAVENGVTFDRTPIVNPRTGENIEPRIRANAGQTPVSAYLNGWRDVDGDGILDCHDLVITPTADNVDGDFLPDWLDPDLQLRHVPFTWFYANLRP